MAKISATPSFVNRGHVLDKTSAALTKSSKDAIELMNKILENPDSTDANKLRAAELLIRYHVSVADIISKDDLTRRIADLKLRNVQPLGYGGKSVGEGPDTPELVFNEVITIDMNKDDENVNE